MASAAQVGDTPGLDSNSKAVGEAPSAARALEAVLWHLGAHEEDCPFQLEGALAESLKDVGGQAGPVRISLDVVVSAGAEDPAEVFAGLDKRLGALAQREEPLKVEASEMQRAAAKLKLAAAAPAGKAGAPDSVPGGRRRALQVELPAHSLAARAEGERPHISADKMDENIAVFVRALVGRDQVLLGAVKIQKVQRGAEAEVPATSVAWKVTPAVGAGSQGRKGSKAQRVPTLAGLGNLTWLLESSSAACTVTGVQWKAATERQLGGYAVTISPR